MGFNSGFKGLMSRNIGVGESNSLPPSLPVSPSWRRTKLSTNERHRKDSHRDKHIHLHQQAELNGKFGGLGRYCLRKGCRFPSYSLLDRSQRQSGYFGEEIICWLYRRSSSMQPSPLETDRGIAWTVEDKAPITVVKIRALMNMIMKVTVPQKEAKLLICSGTTSQLRTRFKLRCRQLATHGLTWTDIICHLNFLKRGILSVSFGYIDCF